MADAGRDIAEQEAEQEAINKGLVHHDQGRQSFASVNKDFGVEFDDDPQLDNDPILPHRKRLLAAACICILGEENASAVDRMHHVIIRSLLSVNVFFCRQ